ncbi:MAG: alkaline phosphatase family protein [Polyangiaceae bacterium]
MSNVARGAGRFGASAGVALAVIACGACSAGCRSSSASASPAPPAAASTPAPAVRVDAIHVTKKGDDGGTGRHPHAIETAFVILMENSNWSDIQGSPDAPYINSLLPKASYCTRYYDNPLGVHPSEPNYIWIESGFHQGLTTDYDPSAENVTSADHLTKQMDAAGLSWKAYAEDAPPGTCPIEMTGNYAPKHVPQVFFSDVVGKPPSTTSPQCIRHVVPYTELARDLASGNVPRYAFIAPNQCDDMHGGLRCPLTGETRQGDDWLARNLPSILQSRAYADGGAIFITWDESTHGADAIGMIVLSPAA